MKSFVIFIFLLACVVSCSSSKTKQSKKIQDFSFIRVYEQNSNWEPEPNCQFVSYEKVPGVQMQSEPDGFDNGVEDLKQHVFNIGGTVAKIRDFTEDYLWANVYFCSDKYDKFQK